MRVGQARRRDKNEAAIVKALEAAGALVTRVSGEGAPDLLVRYRGEVHAFEVKSEKGKRTEAQELSQWPVIRTVDEALRFTIYRRGGPQPPCVTAGETMELARAGVTIAARGGAKIWSMRENWMLSRCTCKTTGRELCLRHKGQEALNQQMCDGADPDGFAVFGQFPNGFLADVIRMKLLGDVARDEVLHVCSGTLGPRERWTVDMRLAARPSVVARGEALPFRDGTFGAVMLDPPYSEEYARNLYRSEFPRPSHLLREAARVVKPSGRIGLLHIAVPITPAGCEFVTSFGVVPGPGFRIRAFTIYQRDQVGLFVGPERQQAMEQAS